MSSSSPTTIGGRYLPYRPAEQRKTLVRQRNDAFYSDEKKDDGCTTPTISGNNRLDMALPGDDTCSTRMQYYRVVYRGVVALLAEPNTRATRGSHYVSYGEIIASQQELSIKSVSSPNSEDGTLSIPLQSTNSFTDTESTIPSLPGCRPLSIGSSSDSTNNTNVKNSTKVYDRAIRVDQILTGGYAIDQIQSDTPKRSNRQEKENEAAADSNNLGYIISKSITPVLERLNSAPKVESHKHHVKVVSRLPISVLTGPAADAPLTKAKLLPGTIHEVQLRVQIDNRHYLRLCNYRGWIVMEDDNDVAAVQEVTCQQQADQVAASTCSDDCSVSVLSVASSSITLTPNRNRRHRPPRRLEKLPRQVIGRLPQSRVSRHDTPSSNVSIMSDESSLDKSQKYHHHHHHHTPASPELSYATAKSNASSASSTSTFYLMRVTAPRGLKILDAPQFQVNNLLHSRGGAQSSAPMQNDSAANHSIFHTMSGRLTSTGPSRLGNPAVFDAGSKTRILPRGALFEASKRMERTGSFSQGAGLIKLSDQSGWAIVPRQDELNQQYRKYSGGMTGVREGEAMRAFEEVGNAHVDHCNSEVSCSDHDSVWIRVLPKAGIPVSCAPPVPPMRDTLSPASSKGSSAVTGSNIGPTSHDSDVASSVGSGFLDAMFRTPKKKGVSELPEPQIAPDQVLLNTVVPCGSCLQTERWLNEGNSIEFARLKGCQGWIPLSTHTKVAYERIMNPEFRFGSFWFRVKAQRGIRVFRGPSRRAPSIKSEDGHYFRFECGEFLRASEVMTVFDSNGSPVECFAKLYRNRHVELYNENNIGECRPLASLTLPAEWVQVYVQDQLYLDECAEEPRIERLKTGWRYNVLCDTGVVVRKGPSFASEKTGATLLVGESVLISERVSPPGDRITWLQLKDGHGWVHDINDEGKAIMIAHSLRHRKKKNNRKQSRDQAAYNTIIARLFHNEDGAYQHPGGQR